MCQYNSLALLPHNLHSIHGNDSELAFLAGLSVLFFRIASTEAGVESILSLGLL